MKRSVTSVMKARIGLVAGAIAAMAVAIATTVGLGAFAVPAQAVTVGDGSGGCSVVARGYLKNFGIEDSQQRWTERFSVNNCHLPVRARVTCGYMNWTIGGYHYGGVIHRTGYSYYTCALPRIVETGNAQVKVNGRWKNIRNAN